MAKRNCSILQRVTAASCALLLAGCAIRPVPTNYGSELKSRFPEKFTTTTAIVQRVRCEARHAIARVTMGFIENDFKGLFKYRAGDPDVEWLRDKVTANGEDPLFDLIVRELFDKETQQFTKESKRRLQRIGDTDLSGELDAVAKFANAGVGYQFTFEITLDRNINSAVLNFDFPFRSGSFKLGIGGDYQRRRKNSRTFKIAETISDIVFDPELDPADKGKKLKCNERDFDHRKNYHFPIYGKINLFDSFSTFAGIIVKAGLGDKRFDREGNPLPSVVESPDFKKFAGQDLTDRIMFTTTVKGTANPSITLNPVANGLRLDGASAGVVGSRTDLHSLTLIIQQNNRIDDLLAKLEYERLRNENNGIIAFPTGR